MACLACETCRGSPRPMPPPSQSRGYAILDGPTMPIIGEGDQEANDT